MDASFSPVVAFDPTSLTGLKKQTATAGQGSESPEALKKVAKQFEALFLQMVLKSMRDATPQDSLFDSEQTRMFRGMADEQLALNLSETQGVGLADAIVRQMSPYLKNSPANSRAASLYSDPPPAGAIGNAPSGDDAGLSAQPTASGNFLPLTAAKPAAAADTAPQFRPLAPLQRRAAQLANDALDVGEAAVSSVQGLAGKARNFARQVWPHAQEVSRQTGIPAAFIVAHAALETGWGRAILKGANGESSQNVFNIKTGKSWQGNRVTLPVTEYANGRARTETASFRAYGSLAESFRDYANMLMNNDRYANVRGQQSGHGFARALQDAGYATDPQYAQKLAGLINSNVLKVALSGLQ